MSLISFELLNTGPKHAWAQEQFPLRRTESQVEGRYAPWFCEKMPSSMFCFPRKTWDDTETQPQNILRCKRIKTWFVYIYIYIFIWFSKVFGTSEKDSESPFWNFTTSKHRKNARKRYSTTSKHPKMQFTNQNDQYTNGFSPVFLRKAMKSRAKLPHCCSLDSRRSSDDVTNSVNAIGNSASPASPP